MELRIKIDKMDYGGILQQAIPVVLEKLGTSHGGGKMLPLLRRLGDAPAGAARAALNVLPQEMKDRIAVLILQSYKEELVGMIHDFAARKGIEVTVSDIELKL